jgi:predicted MFS family arabinose efflux permease
MKADLNRKPERLTALHHPNFALLWTGQAVSVVGNGIFTVALLLEVFRLTSSSFALGVIVSARTIPSVLLLLVGGSLVDRLSRRLVMLVSDTICGLCVSLVAVLIALGVVQLWELALLSIVFGLANSFFMPASTAIVKDILPRSLLVSGNSLTSLAQSLGQYLAGPLAGGALVATVGTAWAFGIDGISFFVSACCLALMRSFTSARDTEESVLRRIRKGLRYSRSQPWLWWPMIALGVANLVSFVPLTILEALLVSHVFKAGPVALGIIYAASGAGGSIASLYVSRAGAPRNPVRAMWTAWIIAGLAAVLLGLSPSIWAAAVFAAVIWGGVTYGNVLWLPMLQARVPPELLGRVSSLDWLISLALTPLGMVAAGGIAAVIGVRLTLIAGGIIAACTGAVLFIPGVRDPDRQNALGTQSA